MFDVTLKVEPNGDGLIINNIYTTNGVITLSENETDTKTEN